MKRLICVCLTGLLFLGGRAGAAEAPVTCAGSGILIDADSGRVLWERSADERRLIASTTKLMTALVALESGHAPEEVVTIRPEWTGIEGSSLYLKPGEKLTLSTLLYGLLLRSGNDAAHAVAGYCGGDIPTFVARMNEKAVALGMHNTHFDNPSGLDGETHYSTARDMAVLARACLEDETLREIVSGKSVTMENRVMTNHNKLLWRVEGCVGLKTGYTQRAGRTLVSAVRRDGMTFICVTLNDPDDWKDHAALYDYAFANCERRLLLTGEETICRLPVEGSFIPFCPASLQEDLWITAQRGEEAELQIQLLEPVLTAPVRKGQVVGSLSVWVNGAEVARVPLCAAQEIPSARCEETNWFARFFGR